MDRISELIVLFLVGLGQKLSRLSEDETAIITLFLASLLVAALVAHTLQIAVVR
jgi:hypothetical protein